MKKLLLTWTKGNNRYLSMFFFLLTMTIGTSSISAQTTGLTDCMCLNNESYPGSGQFRAEAFVFANPGDTWTVVSSDGFYDYTMPNPATAVYYPFGTPMIEGSGLTAGRFMLEGLHYSDYFWSVTVTDGSQVLTIKASHTCAYPDKTIRGDKDVCLGESQDYWINESSSNLVGPLVWTLSGGGTMTVTGTRVSVDWDNVVGDHTLTVSDTTLQGCGFSEEVTIYIRDTEAIPMACNKKVNISINPSCVTSITADMILEDMQFTDDAYEIILRHVEVDTIIPLGVISGDYIGISIEVSVIHECSGNSCWGNIFIEDKNIPDLVCPTPDTLKCDESVTASLNDLPIPSGVTAVADGNGGFVLEGFDGCGIAFLTYQDSVVSESLCTGPISSIISRHWTVTDETGNTSDCYNEIYIERATIADVTYPGHWDDVLGPNPTIVACSTFPKLPNGHPHPSHTGRPDGTFCLNAEVSYRDVKIKLCGEFAFKIIRKWKVIDLCTSTIEIHNQNITVMDTIAPICTAPDEYSVNTKDNSCASQIKVKPPIVQFECSGWDYYVSYKIRDESGNPYLNPTTDDVVGSKKDGYTILNIPPGQDTIWIIYNIYDECGNFNKCATEVAIIDNEEPVPVCDHHTFVGLNEDGEACVSAATFDNGSWDNCGIARISVSRMGANSCKNTCPTGFVNFCCDDIGEIIMVQMTVWDHAGNSNNCMVEVEVQDNIAPVITFCPKDRTVDCSALPLSYSQYGTAEASDACDVTITEKITETINECGEGYITRDFTASDDQGNEVTCTQIITVKATSPFKKTNIRFPRNHTILDGCSDTDTDPENLKAPYNKPKITERPCSQVTVNYEDQVFQFVDDACYKILRTWTVVDWCQYVPLPYNPPYDVKGKWTHEQIIKVMNSSAPKITKGCSNVTIKATPDANCKLTIDLIAEANDDCSSADNLVWTYKVDMNSDGSINKSGTTNDASGLFPSGTHKVTWTVADDCGNIASCTQTVIVQDDKNPTPYCLSGIVSVMPTEGEIAIWASDFDKGSFDNCPGDGNVKIAFSSNPNDTGRVFTCADMTGSADTFAIQMYVIDDEGNFDYCDTKFIIQDNRDVCPDDPIVVDTVSGMMVVAGLIYTEDHKMMKDVDVLLMSNNGEDTSHDMTEEGAFRFDITMNNDIMVEPSKNGNYMEGVSTLDLILIQRHILRLKQLDSPYKIIAADIDDSGRITAMDLIQLRKLILGKYTELPFNTSWRFVDALYEFENEELPFPYEEQVNYYELDHSAMNTDFIAVKIGDVDNSLSFNSDGSGNRDEKVVAFTYAEEVKGEVATMEVFTADDYSAIEGFQTTLSFDINKYEFLSIMAGSLLITDQNVNTDLMARGIITISYNEAVMVDDVNEALFQLEFATKETVIENISFNADKIRSEIYIDNNGTIEAASLTLKAQGNEINVNGFELYQNIPNPFEDYTTISFNMESGSKVNIRVFDLTGKVVYQSNDSYPKGINEIRIEAKDINASGLLYYQLETGAGTLGNKMILIK